MLGRRECWLVVAGAAGAALVAAACGSGAAREQTPEQDAPLEQLTSVVQLGDSIASGEGTLYGYEWDADTKEWTGGNIDAPWPVPYPDCHTSEYAYGNIVAAYFGAELRQYACTGATFDNGITAARTYEGTEYRPAEFGDWAAKTDLNSNYDEAEAQLVLITLGADDVQFSAIVEDCIENAYEYYVDLEDLRCTEENPGDTIETDFEDFLPTLEQNYETLVGWIKERAETNGAPDPKIVFTNYADPLPNDGAQCNDTNYLYPEQVEYLSGLVVKMNGVIVSTVEGLNDPNVAVVDIEGAYTVQGTSHLWCSDDPWAYGLSIYSVSSPSSFESNAPFHPTPDGQESIAEHVIPVVRQWFEEPADDTTSTSPASPTTDSPPTTG